MSEKNGKRFKILDVDKNSAHFGEEYTKSWIGKIGIVEENHHSVIDISDNDIVWQHPNGSWYLPFRFEGIHSDEKEGHHAAILHVEWLDN